ncbi:MAG: hypothetical protein ACTHM1_10485 [Solirubrobacteraceae bacterium]
MNVWRRREALAAMASPALLRTGRLGRVLGPSLDLSLAAGVGHALKALRADRRADANDGDPTLDTYRPIWQQAAAALDAELEDLGGGFLRIANGARATTVWRHLVELDNPVALRLSGDRAAVHRVLSSAGLPTPRHAAFERRDLSAARRLMDEHPGPWVVKPAFGTGRGRGVTCGVSTPADLRRAAVWAARWSSSMLIEHQGTGEEHRVLVLDGEVLDVIRRRPPQVTGDGRRSVAELIEAENAKRAQSSGALGLFAISVNLDCLLTLRDAGMTLGSVPGDGVEIPVKKTANENGSQDNESVIDAVGPDFRSGMRVASAAIGARLVSIEVIGPSLDDGPSLSGGLIVEVNTTPGLHYHYQVANPHQSVRVAVSILRTLLESTDA